MTDSILPLPYTVSFWGSHPDDDNDDCWTGEDFASLGEAMEAFRGECLDRDVAYILVDGPDVHTTRKNPHHRPRKRRPAGEDDADRSERAMQAGMAFGCDGYNDEMGWG